MCVMYILSYSVYSFSIVSENFDRIFLYQDNCITHIAQAFDTAYSYLRIIKQARLLRMKQKFVIGISTSMKTPEAYREEDYGHKIRGAQSTHPCCSTRHTSVSVVVLGWHRADVRLYSIFFSLNTWCDLRL